MRLPFHVFAIWARSLRVSTLLLAVVATGKSADMSGVYEDRGTLVSSSPFSATEPSFYGALSLVFDPELTNALHGQTSRIIVKHAARELQIEVYDSDDVVIWSRRWKEGEGYVQQGNSVILRFRVGAWGTEEIFMILQPADTGGLLELTMQRVKPTALGPAVLQKAIYLFHQLP